MPITGREIDLISVSLFFKIDRTLNHIPLAIQKSFIRGIDQRLTYFRHLLNHDNATMKRFTLVIKIPEVLA